MKPEQLVEQNYYKFCLLPGSEYIASEFALLKILKIIRAFKIKFVLEIGLGIGSISDTVLESSHLLPYPVDYSGTEANEFCLAAIKKNVKQHSKIKTYTNLSEVERNKKFDLIIIDGQDESLSFLAQRCNPRAIVFIEGDRKPQINLIMSIFPKANHVQVISLKKNKAFSTGEQGYFMGGGQLIFTNPDLYMKMYWIREKIITGLKRQIRKIL